MHEAPRTDKAPFALAVGQQVEALLDHAAEKFRTPPAAIEDDRHLPLADGGAHLSQQLGEGLDQGGIEFGDDQQQWIPSAVVYPVVAGGRHGQMAPRKVGLGDRALAVVGTYVPIAMGKNPISCPRCATRTRAISPPIFWAH